MFCTFNNNLTSLLLYSNQSKTAGKKSFLSYNKAEGQWILQRTKAVSGKQIGIKPVY